MSKKNKNNRVQNQKSILVTSNMYLPNLGGIENSMYHLAQEYVNLGYNVIIVTSDINNQGKTLPQYEFTDGVKIYRYKANSKQGGVAFIRHLYNAFSLYKKILSQYKPSCVICRHHFNLVLLKLAGCSNISYIVPSVVENETRISMAKGTTFFNKLRSKASFNFHLFLQQRAFNYARHLFVFSQNMHSQVNAIINRKDIAVTKPGVSLKRFFPVVSKTKNLLREDLGLSSTKFVFLCVGRLINLKGFDVAIRAIADIHETPVELWILGDGPLYNEYNDLIHELGCQDKVKLLGRQQAPELYYRAADAFIMSSTHEALGQTILEALASGLPIIAAHASAKVITASDEIINEKMNLFTKDYSIESFSTCCLKLARLSEHELSEIGQFNRAEAENSFSWKALALLLINTSLVQHKES